MVNLPLPHFFLLCKGTTLTTRKAADVMASAALDCQFRSVSCKIHWRCLQKPDQNCRQYFLASSSQRPMVALKKSAV